MKILAFAASSSKQSINKQLVTYTSNLIADASVELVDINDYEMPLFSVDREAELGSPQKAQDFYAKIGEADALIISFAEHNGSYTAAYKNLFDWTSRINSKVFQNKPLLLLSTSPGARGGASVLQAATNSAPHFAGDVKGSICVPSFQKNFDQASQKITNSDIKAQLLEAINKLVN